MKSELILGDSREILTTIKNETIDLTVTSPPYDDLRTYNNTLKWDFEIFKNIANELYRVTKQGGVVVWIVGDKTNKGSETGTSFKQALYFKEIGFNLHDTMIWQKPNSFNFGSNYCYKQTFEYMFILSKGKPKSINLIKDNPSKTAGKILKGARKHSNGARDKAPDFKCNDFKRRDNIWSIGVGGNNYGHPAVFPLQLAKDHIISWSNEGDLILDAFAGSGTVGVACKELNRNFIGIEIVEDYYKIMKERVGDNNGIE